MRVVIKPFPVIYFYASCSKHRCNVDIKVDSTNDFYTKQIIGGQITAVSCDRGGPPEKTDCVDCWELSVDGGEKFAII